MSVRRLAETQPESFAFTEANVAWAEREIAKYPAGRQASAVISLLWKAQEQEGWVSEPAIRTVAGMLDMPLIRVLEIATFYTMFQLEPVGTKAHIQVCGTTPCWLRGADDLKAVCRKRISPEQHTLSDDGAFSWEEVECLGACVNAPMIQIGTDTYEDLTAESFGALLDDIDAGRPIRPGPQIDRQFAAPVGGPTSLTEDPTVPAETEAPAAEEAATESPAREAPQPPPAEAKAPAAQSDLFAADEKPRAAGEGDVLPAPDADTAPGGIAGPREGGSDDLKLISGIGPKIEGILHELGIFHFDQIAAWTEAEADWVDMRLTFKGRIGREQWIEQAQAIVAERSGGEGAD